MRAEGVYEMACRQIFKFVRKLIGVSQQRASKKRRAAGGEGHSLLRYAIDRTLSVMRPLRYSINVTLDGCCDHREVIADEDLHRHAAENLEQADALLLGRVTYEMMEAAWRRPPPRCLHHFVGHPAKEEGIGLLEVLGCVTVQVFVRDHFTMIAAPV